MTKEEVEIDHRIHSYIIGRGGKEIKRIQQQFKVELKLPRDGDGSHPDIVTVSAFKVPCFISTTEMMIVSSQLNLCEVKPYNPFLKMLSLQQLTNYVIHIWTIS